jgi:hypothetical protein
MENLTMIEESTFEQFKEISKEDEYLVLLGCGGDLMEWVTGVAQILREENIALPGFEITKALKVTTTGGRTDLMLIFDFNKVDIGKLAIWRIGFGDCSWLSDYVVNYVNQHYLSTDYNEFMDYVEFVDGDLMEEDYWEYEEEE